MTSLIENLARIKGTFDDIKNAIIGKGGVVGDTVDTYAAAITNIPSVGPIETEEKTAAPATTAQDILPSEGKYLSKVTVEAMPTVDIPNPSIRSLDEMIIARGEWTPGYTVDNSYEASVSAPSLSPDLAPNNVLEGKTIFGVSGTNKGWDAGVKHYQPKTVSYDAETSGNASVVSQDGMKYVLPAKVPRRAYGTVTTSANTAKKVTLGWKPRYVAVIRNRSSSYVMANLYYAGTNLNVTTGQSSSSATANITIDNDGFTLAAQGTYYGTCYYLAIE